VTGGGYIGLEMASVWDCLGSEIMVVEFGDVIVPSLDAEIRKAFQQVLEIEAKIQPFNGFQRILFDNLKLQSFQRILFDN
jgi:pyruvate/2-oxoglutarate dehydrogenase complex dihydrolipoamide dehydrogenase (E3) component